jgi:alpha-beta hydrolase superfamily lysophospholipase
VSFAKAAQLMPRPLERVGIDSPDGILPGYLVPARAEGRTPVVIFYNGFDVTKELLYGFIREEFADRGIACLVIDTPGTGEPLRLRNVPSRPDYEVPTTAIVDYLVTRPDIDPERIGLLGISLGGYYAPRGASFEHRIKACAAWGGVWDYGAVWATPLGHPVQVHPGAVLAAAVGHGHRNDGTGTRASQAVDSRRRDPAPDPASADCARRRRQRHPAVRRAEGDRGRRSTDKELRVFTGPDGGEEHCNADDPDPARQLIADWFAGHL